MFNYLPTNLYSGYGLSTGYGFDTKTSVGYEIGTILSPFLGIGLGWGVSKLTDKIQYNQQNSFDNLNTQLDELKQQRANFIKSSGFEETEISGYKEANLISAQNKLQSNQYIIDDFTNDDKKLISTYEANKAKLDDIQDKNSDEYKKLEQYLDSNLAEYNGAVERKKQAEAAEKQTAELQAKVKEQEGLKLANEQLAKLDEKIRELEVQCQDAACEKSDGTKLSRSFSKIDVAEFLNNDNADFTKHDLQKAVYEFSNAKDGSDEKLKWANVLVKMRKNNNSMELTKSQRMVIDMAEDYVKENSKNSANA